ncbi:MAG TPA: hypothetical protein VMM15_06965 [Bradyrhizobium sp.]|nr:hypothetical protein [Bradyrhizobium sp.]
MKLGLREWSTRKLQSGDLTALSAIAGGAARTDEDRLKRLSRRGFVAERRSGSYAVTARGRVALLIRKLSLA